MTVQIDKVIQVILQPDDMEAVSEDLSDHWADYQEIVERNLTLYVTPEQLSALVICEADYIAFRLAE